MENILFEIETVSEDTSLRFRLVYITGRKLRGKKQDKTWPKVTQCLLFKNGLFISCGEVVKCDDDVDNMEYALKLVTKKVITDIWFKELRKPIWEQLFVKISLYNGAKNN